MPNKSFSLGRIKHKVAARRLLTSDHDESGSRIIISDADLDSLEKAHGRIRSRLFALPLGPRLRSGLTGRARLLLITGLKLSTKELIQQERDTVIAKKLHAFLHEFGLQSPTTLPQKLLALQHSGLTFAISTSNDVIYLPAVTLGSLASYDEETGDDDNDGLEANGLAPVASTQRHNSLSQHSPERQGSTDLALELAPNPLQAPTFDVTEAEPVDSPESTNNSRTDSPHDSIDQTLRASSAYLDRATRSRSSLVSSLGRQRNYLTSKVDVELSIHQMFALVITVTKEQQLKLLKFKFQSVTSIFWPSGDVYNKQYRKERFKLGCIEWTRRFKDADFYIDTANSNQCRSRDISEQELNNRTVQYPSFMQIDDTTSLGEYVVKPGIYVFLFPTIISPTIPATISSINGTLNHLFLTQICRSSSKLNRKQTMSTSYEVHMVRTPPSVAHLIATKPIYVNRVWNDSLHYTIIFPHKYVPLGSEHKINLKLVPLVKDVLIKRVKFNVLERITYVSEDLEKEIDFDSADPFHLRMKDGKVRERVVSVCELKTRLKQNSPGSEPYKEEVVRCPENNLLFSCYEPETEKNRHMREKNKEVMIASPLEIEIGLPLLTTKADKIMRSPSDCAGVNHETSVSGLSLSDILPMFSSSSRSNNDPGIILPTIGAVETHLHHSVSELKLNPPENSPKKSSKPEDWTPESLHYMHDGGGKENIAAGYTSVQRALYPDSNFRHIQISHRLQVCFRISKPDVKDNYKMHHYEVVVDTPLVLMSAKCIDGSIQLPRYEEASGTVSFKTPEYERGDGGVVIKPLNQDDGEVPPSFEEAISATTSPLMRTISIDDPISRVPLLDDPAPSYEESETSIDRVFLDDLNVFNQEDDLYKTCLGPTTKERSRLRSSLLASFAPGVHEEQDNNSATTVDGQPLVISELAISELSNSELVHSELVNSDLVNSDLVNSDLVNSELINSVLVSGGTEAIGVYSQSEGGLSSGSGEGLNSETGSQVTGPSEVEDELKSDLAHVESKTSTLDESGPLITADSEPLGSKSILSESEPKFFARPQPTRCDTTQSSIYALSTFDYAGVARNMVMEKGDYDQVAPLLLTVSTETDIDKTDNISLFTSDLAQRIFHAY